MASFKKVVRKYFYFTRSQRIGFSVLIFINFLIFILYFFKKEPKLSLSKNNFSQKIDSFYFTLKTIEENQYLSRLDKYILARYDTLKLFKFNPNTATDQDFIRLGLTKKQIANIRKYLQNGGKFYVKEDFKRIYGIRPRQYFILEPYIDLPSEKQKKSQLFFFDPNTVSKQQLIKLGFSPRQAQKFIESRQKGWKFYTPEDFRKHYLVSDKMYLKLKPYIKIDPSNLIPEINSATYYDLLFITKNKKMASRIINFRNKLGGFYSLEQIKEVYGMTDTLYNKIINSVKLDPSKIRKININQADYKQLAAHPYIRKQKAQLIIRERQKSKIKSFKDLETRKIFDAYQLERLKQYLTF